LKRESSYDIFGQFVAFNLSKYSPDGKLKAKVEIMKVLDEAAKEML